MDIENLLKETLELTEYQVTIYLSLLEKTGTAGEVLRRLNINRGTLYRVIDELVQQGLLIKHVSGKRLYFEAVHPDQLMDIYRKRKISFEEKEITLQRAVYELLRRSKVEPTNASISIEKGVYAHYRSMKLQMAMKEKVVRQKLTHDSTLYEYSNYPELGDYMSFVKEFISNRIARDIRAKQLINSNLISGNRELDYSNRETLKIVKILPSEILPGISLKMFDDYTIITLHARNPDNITIITIKEATTTLLMKSMFDYIFDRSVESHKTPPIPTIKTKENIKLSLLGVGTSGIGGYWNKLHSYTDDIGDIDQIRHAISKGMNYVDACLIYGEGHTVEVLGKAIKNIPRSNLFITGKLTRVNGELVKDRKGIIEQCNTYLKVLGVDYIDQFQIHSKSSLDMPQEEVMSVIEELIIEGKVKHWGVGNYRTIEDLEEVQNSTKYPIFANEIPYGVYSRQYEDNGILEYMRKRNILTIAYFAIKRGGLLADELNSTDLMIQLGKKYEKSPVQIALNWLVNKPFTMALVKATNGTHINENIQALGWKMEESDYLKIDTLKINA